MNKKKLQSAQTQKNILIKSKELFIQKGFAATSIENISEATGTSKGNIYYHFKSKEGLFLHILEDWERDWEEQWNLKKHQYASSTEQLYGIAEHMIAHELNHPLTSVADEFFSSDNFNSEVHQRLDEIINLRLTFNQSLLSEGIHSGEFQDGDTLLLAQVLEALFNGVSYMCKNLSVEETLKLYKLSMDVFLFGISPH